MVYDYEDGYILLGQVNQPDADSQSALIADITTELALLVREMKYMNRDLKQAKQHISDINQVDELTGLANRRYFHQRFKEDLAYANRYITPLTLVSLDLDNYKKVKERNGQRLADAILKQIGIILNSHCRSSDLAAHYVNDEFCIVLPHTTLIAGVQFAERIRMAIIKCRLEREQMLQLTASFGVVENHNNPSIHSLLNLADKALYQAKKTGKNKVCVYS
jgi:diguanylate cyclase (GGDEF)-like protein